MSLRILLVDDSPAMRSFIRRTILLSGVTVESFLHAGDGKEALEVLEQERVDLVLCDVNMPVMNGESFLAELHARGATESLAILVVSTDATVTRMQRMMSLGARGYVQKPFTPESMREALETVIPHVSCGGAN